MANNDYITTDCKLTVSKNTAKLDEEIFLYKNDRNIKLLIEIVDNKYRYKPDDLSNLLVKYKASYAQVKWYKNAEVKKEFPIQATDDGKVVFVIEGELINEDTELGDYDLQLRLLNESQESIRSLPIIKGAVHILKPLFEEGDIATVNSAIADVSMLSLGGDAIDTYNSDGTYNQTNWGSGDIISSSKLNKLEKVAKDNVDKVNKMPAKSIVEGGKIYLAKEDGTKLDSGTELPAGGSTIEVVNNLESDSTTAALSAAQGKALNTQYKDIAKNKQILLVTQKQYEDLISGKEVTIDDVKYTYNENTIYGITDNIDSNTILTSPNGTEYILKVDDNGNISTELKPIICTSVLVNKSNLTFNSKSEQTLTATFTPVNTSEAKVWSSSNESVAKVANGIVTPVSNGQCTIKITCGTKSATCSVVVNMPVEIKDFTNYAYNTDTFTNPISTTLQNNKTYYMIYNLNKTINDGVMTLTKKDNLTSTDNAYLLVKVGIGDNNTYYCRAKIKTNASSIIAGNNQDKDKDSVLNDGEWHLVSYIFKDSNPNTNGFTIECTTLNGGESVQIKELMKINLTEIYGINNEPTKEVCDTVFTNYKTGLVG